MTKTDTIDLIEKLKPNVFTSKIAALPDLMKTYLFQIKFEFRDPTLTKYEDDLTLRAKAVDVSDQTIEITFDEFQDLLVTKLYHTPAFRSTAVDIIIDCWDSTLANCIGTFRYNNTHMFRGHERNMQYHLDTTADTKQTRKIVFLMSSDVNDQIMPTL